MGYYLQAFIGKQPGIEVIEEQYSLATVCALKESILLIPMTEGLFDQINSFATSETLLSFQYLTTNIEQKILKLIKDESVAYIEAEFHGGQGGQTAIIWKDGIRMTAFEYGQDAINSVLKLLGVTADENKDEFDTIGLGQHRNTEDWVD